MAKDAVFSVRVSAEQKDQLERLAEKEDRSIAQLIRIAVARFLAQMNHPSRSGGEDEQ